MKKAPILAIAAVIVVSAVGGPKAAPRPVNLIDLIRKSEYQLRGKTLEAKLSLTIIRGHQERNQKFNLLAEGTEKAVVKITAPAKDRGMAHLRIKDRLWLYTPENERIIPIAPSMAKLPWMGADFSNADLVRYMNLSRFYLFRSLGEETVLVQGTSYRTLKIECTPKKDASVEQGKIIVWIDEENAVQLRHEYYDESGKLERTAVARNLKKFGDHILTTLIVQPSGQSENYTRIDYLSAAFDHPIDESTFTPEFLRKRIQD